MCSFLGRGALSSGPQVNGSLTGKTLPLLCPRRERPRRLRAPPPGALPIFRRRTPAFSGFSCRSTTFTLVNRGAFSWRTSIKLVWSQHCTA